MSGFFDTFDDTQLNSDPPLPSSAATHWGPTPSTRELSIPMANNVIANQDINISSSGQWFLRVQNVPNVTGATTFRIIYSFAPAADFSNITSIFINQASANSPDFLNNLNL